MVDMDSSTESTTSVDGQGGAQVRHHRVLRLIRKIFSEGVSCCALVTGSTGCIELGIAKRWRARAPTSSSMASAMSRARSKNRSMPRRPRTAGPTRKPSGNCSAKRNPRCSSPHPRNWANWLCFYAHPPRTTCAASLGTWTAVGRRSNSAELEGRHLGRREPAFRVAVVAAFDLAFSRLAWRHGHPVNQVHRIAGAVPHPR